MNDKCFLAVDLGAESGRVLAGHWNGADMRLEEVHRFPNGGVWIGGTLRWDIVRIVGEIERGMALGAAKYGSAIASIAVDTWALDYVLLSSTDEMLGLPHHYRDARTRGLVDAATTRLSRQEIYAESGIQFMEINSLCQLMAAQRDHPETLEKAANFLMIPDFLNWCLCGAKVAEFTNATTTQFLHPTKKAWSTGMMEKLGLPTHFLPPLVNPGADLGFLRDDVAERTGLSQVRVIAPATHDTGSAVAAVPADSSAVGGWAYLSSGTWSLMGVELSEPDLSTRACELNMTNEGGVDGTYRLLKNIMGLWLVQQCRKSFERRGTSLSYDGLLKLAGEAPAFRSILDVDDSRFLNPPDMPEAIASYCRDTQQTAPETEGQFVRCALESLALKYAIVFEWLVEMTGKPLDTIHVVGGGSRNGLLNQFTADACQRRVVAGPVEATGLGNLLVQARAAGDISTLDEIRTVSRRAAQIEEYTPGSHEPWLAARERLNRLVTRR
jgi:rhamnulokinase